VVRKSLKNTRVQFVDYHANGDGVRVSAVSNELVKYYQWKYSTATTSAAYLTGLLAGKRALDEGITEGVFDVGRHPPVNGSKVFAALKGVVDAGVACSYNQEKLPGEERILGKHLNEEIAASVNDIKNKITGGKQ
jgi:large subunit ribosomal protein L18